MVASVSECIAHALAGFDALATIAEPVTDEWQYLADLDTVWRARLLAVSTSRGAEPAPVALGGRDRGARRGSGPHH